MHRGRCGSGLVGWATVGICAAKALAHPGQAAVRREPRDWSPGRQAGRGASSRDHFIDQVSGGHSNILEIRNIATDVVDEAAHENVIRCA